jgi:hypothetical protein
MEVLHDMNGIFSRRAALLGLGVALFSALLPASANRGRPGPGGEGGNQPAIPAGSAGVRATISAVDATAGTIQLTDRNGLTATLKTSSSTVITLDGKTAKLSDLQPNDTATAIYDRQTLVASRIDATSPPPTVLTGTITAVDATTGAVGITTGHGTGITLTVNSNTQLRLNGSSTTAANLAVGQLVRVSYRPADKIALALAAATPPTGVVTGAITALDLTAGTMTLTPLVGAPQTVTLNAQSTYRLNGQPVTPSALAVGQLASVRVGTNNTATTVAAQTPPLIDLLGTISALNVQGNTVQITTPGATTITLLTGSFTTVQRNNAASTVAQLAVGDQVQVEYEYLLVPNTSRALKIVATTAPAASPTPTPTPAPATPSAGAAVTALALSPVMVTGGTASTATVTVSTAAGTSGQVVTLASSNPAVATVPATVTVPAGATSVTFPVTTTAVTTATTVTIFATSGGATTSVTLTVNP